MKDTNSTQKLPQPVQPTKKPNEQAGFHFSSSLKISDPQTGQVLLKIRAD